MFLSRLARHDGLNFLLTNRIPRRLASQWVGRISRSENKLICGLSLWVWRRFTELDLSDAADPQFRSMHDCFTRRLRPDARPVDLDPDVLTSPCDAIVGAFGTVAAGQALQVKGMAYALTELLGDAAEAGSFEGGSFVTLRLTAAMYHRFHAPGACVVGGVTHIFGDRWNVNPPALRRVRRLFCRNERVAVRTVLEPGGQSVTLVAVAAILVSGIRLGFLPPLATDGGRPTLRRYACNSRFAKGAEMGWFEHGSTIVVLAPAGIRPVPALQEGALIRMGQPLLRLPITERGCDHLGRPG